MRWRFTEAAIDEFVEYIRRVFTYHDSFTNEGATGVINLGLDNKGIAFDHYFREFEQYPVITVSGQGGPMDDAGIGGVKDEERYEQVIGSSVGVTRSATIGTSLELSAATAFVSEAEFTLRTVETFMKGRGPAGSVTVSLYEGDTVLGPVQLVASGSITGFTSSKYVTKSCELYPNPDLEKEAYYWLSYSTDSESEYALGVNSSVPRLRAYRSGSQDWTVVSGSIASVIQGAPHVVIGGTSTFGLLFNCVDRTATKSRRLAELVAIFLKLARRGNIDRQISDNVKIDWGALSNMTKKGLAVESVTFGGEQIQERGDEIIYTNSVTVTVRGEWGVAFERALLEELDIDTESY